MVFVTRRALLRSLTVMSVAPGARATEVWSRKFLTLKAARMASIPSAVSAIVTLGYATERDGGAASYQRAFNAAPEPGSFAGADGAVWELVTQHLTPEMFGAVGDGVTNDYPAWQALVALANRRGSVVVNCRAGADYRFTDVFEWSFEWRYGTLVRRDGSICSFGVPRITAGSDHLTWIGLDGMTINGNGARIVSNGKFVIAAQQIGPHRQPKRVTIVPFHLWKCRKVAIRDLRCDGEWRYTTCSVLHFPSSAIDANTGIIAAPKHGLATAAEMTLTTTGSPPTGLAVGVGRSRYFVVVVDPDHIKLARTAADAGMNKTIEISGGTGTHTLRLSIGQRFAYGLRAVGCDDVLIENAAFNNYMGDGIVCTHRFIGGHFEGAMDRDGVNRNWQLSNVHCLRNGRQGISVIGCKGTWRQTGGACSGTGFSGSMDPANVTGVTPGGGIDFEPDRFAEHMIDDCVLTRVELKGNSGAAIFIPWNKGLTHIHAKTFGVESVSAPGTVIRLPRHRYPDAGYGHKLRLETTGVLPAPLEVGTDYWPIKVSEDALALARSPDNALSGTAIAFNDGGRGRHTIFLHDTPSTGRSCQLIDCDIEHPSNAASDHLFQVAAWDLRVMGGRIRNLKGSARISNVVQGDSAPHFQGVEFETTGKLVDLSLGVRDRPNSYNDRTDRRSPVRYNWRFENCVFRYIGAKPLGLASGLVGIFRASYGTASVSHCTFDFGVVGRDNDRAVKAVAFTSIASATNNIYETRVSQATPYRIVIDYTGTPIVADERYRSASAFNPFKIVGASKGAGQAELRSRFR